MTIAHNQLTGADLHEPKGVASATINTVYIADGAGSGSWAAYNTYRTTTIVKTSDTTRSSTSTFAADPTLTFSLAANSTYKIRLVVHFSSGATPDIKVRCSSASGATNRGFIYYRKAGTSTLGADKLSFSGSVGTSIDGSDSDPIGDFIAEIYIATAGSTGTFSLDWAQNTSNSGSTIVRAGSFLEYQKIA